MIIVSLYVLFVLGNYGMANNITAEGISDDPCSVKMYRNKTGDILTGSGFGSLCATYNATRINDTSCQCCSNGTFMQRQKDGKLGCYTVLDLINNYDGELRFFENKKNVALIYEIHGAWHIGNCSNFTNSNSTFNFSRVTNFSCSTNLYAWTKRSILVTVMLTNGFLKLSTTKDYNMTRGKFENHVCEITLNGTLNKDSKVVYKILLKFGREIIATELLTTTTTTPSAKTTTSSKESKSTKQPSVTESKSNTEQLFMIDITMIVIIVSSVICITIVLVVITCACVKISRRRNLASHQLSENLQHPPTTNVPFSYGLTDMEKWNRDAMIRKQVQQHERMIQSRYERPPVPPPKNIRPLVGRLSLAAQSKNTDEDNGLYIDLQNAKENQGMDIYEELNGDYVECQTIEPDPCC